MKYKSIFLTKSILTAFILMLHVGCTMKLVEDQSAGVSGAIIKVAKTTDAFLLNISVTSSSVDGSRAFDNYAGGYAAIENELISLGLQNQVRPINKYAFEIAEIALNKWLEFAAKHEQNDIISDTSINEMRVTMQDIFRAMLIEDEGERYLMIE